MKKMLHALTLATLIAVAAPAWSKGATIRIEITAADLAAPLEIHESIAKQFSIWSASFIDHAQGGLPARQVSSHENAWYSIRVDASRCRNGIVAMS